MTIVKIRKFSFLVTLAVLLFLWGISFCSTEGYKQAFFTSPEDKTLIEATAKGRWAEVEKICLELRKSEPNSYVFTWLLTWAYVDKNNMKDASILRNKLRLLEKRSREAVFFAKRMINTYGDRAISWALLSDAQRLNGAKEESLNSAEKALSLDKGNPFVINFKGNALGDMGHPERAIECFDKVIEIDPNFTDAWYNKGVSLGRMGHYEGALKCYNKAIEIYPNFADAWYNKGMTLVRMSRISDSIECFDKAMRINPDFASACYNKGMALYSLKRYNEAKKCFKRALELGHHKAQRTLEILERKDH